MVAGETVVEDGELTRVPRSTRQGAGGRRNRLLVPPPVWIAPSETRVPSLGHRILRVATEQGGIMQADSSLLVGLLLFSAAPALGAPMEPYGGAGQSGIALWIDRDGSRGTMYMAWGSSGVESFGIGLPPIWGVVGKGPCHFRDHGGWCMAKGRMKELTPAEFSIDPLLESGHMTIERQGFHARRRLDG